MLWVGLVSSCIFYIMNRLKLLRVDEAIELIGLDIAEMGGLSDEVYDRIRTDYALSKSPINKSDVLASPFKSEVSK